uniref:Protein SMG5 n=1 Tax=Aceria tosichella TaxID=561515 RepID=A0A6G1SNS0_9ACAR
MNDGAGSREKQKQTQQHYNEEQQQPQQPSRNRHQTTHDGYRQVLSTANKLEAIQSKLDSVIDLFGTPIVSNLFTKLCNDCMNLLLKCEFKLEEFRKAEELVWRRVYHDIYRLLKTKRQLFRKDDEFLIESHFMSGICFYSSLIVQLRLKYTITNVHGVIIPLNLALVPVDALLDVPERSTNQKSDKKEHDLSQILGAARFSNDENVDQDGDNCNGGLIEAARQWAQQSIYRSLVYMGDIARYLLEFSECDHLKLAFELYKSAAHYQPEHGLPFNQLATLAGGLNYNLDAVCNYMRCCLRPKPFERAEGNMVKIFELNKKQHDELNTKALTLKMSEVIASKDPIREAETLIKAAIVTFLKLASELWFAIGDNLSDNLQNTVVNETQRFFEILREAIELDPILPLAETDSIDISFRPTAGGPCSLDKPRYISPTIMYEFCSISIMLIARRKKQSSSENILKRAISASTTINDNITDLVNTLALNLLHYATSKCQKMITSKIQELRVARHEQSSGKGLSIMPTSDLSLRNCSPISSDATSRRALSRLRQKKAATNYSGDTNRHRVSVTRDNDSDLSELEETALSTIDALEISSEMSEGADYPADDLINLDSSSDDGALMRNSISLALLSKPALRPTRSQNYDQDRKTKFLLNETCNSLPVPDLLTGDLTDISFKTNLTPYQDVSGTPSELNSERLTSSTQSIIETTLTYIYNQTYLPTMKVFFDWLLSDVAIIDSNLESFTSYQNELLTTVNLLVELKKLIELDDRETKEGEIYKHAYSGPEWTQKYPMSCDFPFVNLSPMKSVHDANIDFGQQRELTDPESGFVTIECIIGFSHALTIFLRNKTLKC